MFCLDSSSGNEFWSCCSSPVLKLIGNFCTCSADIATLSDYFLVVITASKRYTATDAFSLLSYWYIIIKLQFIIIV